MDFTVTKGLHTKGSCVVVKHGEMELWIKAETAVMLGQSITATGQALIREDMAIQRSREIRRKTRKR